MQLFFAFLASTFLVINAKIILSDITKKIIPNRLLLILLLIVPIYYVYLLMNWVPVNIPLLFTQIILTFLVSFWLYYYGLWSAWDAKYLLCLWFFIPNIWILPLVANIWLVTVMYLCIYTIYFFWVKVMFFKDFRNFIYSSIMSDIKANLIKYIPDGKNSISIRELIWKSGQFLFIFFTLFITYRLIRILLIEKYFLAENTQNSTEILRDIVISYNSYILFWCVVVLVFLIFIFKKIYRWWINLLTILINKFHPENRKQKRSDTWFFFTILLFLVLMTFILYESQNNEKIHIFEKIHTILTLSLGIFLIIKVLRYIYKIVFELWEQVYIHYNLLKEGEIVDIWFLIQNFKHYDFLESWGYLEWIKNIDNPIWKADIKRIKTTFRVVREYNKKHPNIWFNEIPYIKVLHTFPFWWYILSGFIFTYLFWNSIFIYFTTQLIYGIKNLFY